MAQDVPECLCLVHGKQKIIDFEGKIMEEKKCMGDHQVHICTLAEEKKYQEIKKQVETPNYMCLNCGRVAHKSRSLCNPSDLTDLPYHE